MKFFLVDLFLYKENNNKDADAIKTGGTCLISRLTDVCSVSVNSGWPLHLVALCSLLEQQGRRTMIKVAPAHPIRLLRNLPAVLQVVKDLSSARSISAQRKSAAFNRVPVPKSVAPVKECSNTLARAGGSRCSNTLARAAGSN
jgi:hypothetical protein